MAIFNRFRPNSTSMLDIGRTPPNIYIICVAYYSVKIIVSVSIGISNTVQLTVLYTWYCSSYSVWTRQIGHGLVCASFLVNARVAGKTKSDSSVKRV